MVTKAEIDQFYKDVDALEFKFPNAAISKATGESKGNVSKYLNKVQDPSEEFLKKFYNSFKEVLEKKRIDITVDRDKLLEEVQKDLIRVEARVNFMMITLAEVVSKVDKKAIGIVDSEFQEGTDREVERLLNKLKKKLSGL